MIMVLQEKKILSTKKSKRQMSSLRELKQQLLQFEKDNNSRNVVGRRLWNMLKGGAKRKSSSGKNPRPAQRQRLEEMSLVELQELHAQQPRQYQVGDMYGPNQMILDIKNNGRLLTVADPAQIKIGLIGVMEESLSNCVVEGRYDEDAEEYVMCDREDGDWGWEIDAKKYEVVYVNDEDLSEKELRRKRMYAPDVHKNDIMSYLDDEVGNKIYEMTSGLNEQDIEFFAKKIWSSKWDKHIGGWMIHPGPLHTKGVKNIAFDFANSNVLGTGAPIWYLLKEAQMLRTNTIQI